MESTLSFCTLVLAALFIWNIIVSLHSSNHVGFFFFKNPSTLTCVCLPVPRSPNLFVSVHINTALPFCTTHLALGTCQIMSPFLCESCFPDLITN